MKILHLIIIVLIGLPSSLYGVEVEGVRFAKSVTVEETRLSIRGAGLFRTLGFIKAYVGALYVAEGQSTQDVLSDTAKRLEIEYFHAIKGEDFAFAVYAMWLGEKPMNQAFKRQQLGQP